MIGSVLLRKLVGLTAVIPALLCGQDLKLGCVCPDAARESTTRPLLVVFDSVGEKTALEVCGYLDRRLSSSSVVASEFSVLSCGSNKPVLNFDALQRAEIIARNGRFVITELEHWPFGPNWKWIDVPFRQLMVSAAAAPVVTEKLVLIPPSLSAAEIRAVLNDFESLRSAASARQGERLLDLIGRMLGAALTGDAAAVTAFHQLNEWLNTLRPFDAEAAESYSAATRVYRAYAARSARSQ